MTRRPPSRLRARPRGQGDRIDDWLWHIAPLVVRLLSARCDHGAESAAAQPARPSATTLPVALQPSAAASTWAAQASRAARFSAAQSWRCGDAGAAAADVVQHGFGSPPAARRAAVGPSRPYGAETAVGLHSSIKAGGQITRTRQTCPRHGIRRDRAASHLRSRKR